jgi:hypothetical protein
MRFVEFKLPEKDSPLFNQIFEGKNIRILATDSQSTGSVTNEKGNLLIYKIPTPVIKLRFPLD